MANLLQSSPLGVLTLTATLAFACSSESGEPEAMGAPTSGVTGSAASNTTGTNTSAAATSTSGGSGTATTGASTTGSASASGVTVEGVCRLLCADESTDGDGSGNLDGWGFEMGTSCVVPGGAADTGQACDDPELAEPPDDPSTPGSGVLVGGTCTRVCDDESSDDDGSGNLDGWGWEYEQSCIVPGGVADPGASEACTDFEMPEMPMPSQPGGTVEVDGSCVAVCLDDSTDDDGSGNLDGWGYDEEAMESCVVPGGPADTGTPCS